MGGGGVILLVKLLVIGLPVYWGLKAIPVPKTMQTEGLPIARYILTFLVLVVLWGVFLVFRDVKLAAEAPADDPCGYNWRSCADANEMKATYEEIPSVVAACAEDLQRRHLGVWGNRSIFELRLHRDFPRRSEIQVLGPQTQNWHPKCVYDLDLRRVLSTDYR
jgi:hypothetical protein